MVSFFPRPGVFKRDLREFEGDFFCTNGDNERSLYKVLYYAWATCAAGTCKHIQFDLIIVFER